MSQLKVFLLGSPRVECNDQTIKIGRRKSMALLAYLVMTGETQARDTLATIFWPESDQVSARTSLRITLSALKKAIGDECLVIERESVSLKRGDNLCVDVNHFHKRFETCRKHEHPAEEACPQCIELLSEAADLYCGDFLAGFSLRDSPDFDDWQYFQTESLRLELASILERLAQMLSARQDFEPAIEHTRRWVELDALHEPAHRQLMQLYAQSGQPAAALRQYETCVQVLKKELGIPPQDETERLYQAIHEKRLFSPTSAPSRYGHNLPYHATAFVGREQEILEINRMMDQQSCRLVCLVGPSGIGKTRLALEIAAGKVGSFLQGVQFVSLAGVSSADYLPSAIVDGLGVSLFGQEDPKTQLLNYLQHKELLLVLDNFEQLLSGAGLLSEILSKSASVKLLVTSRERLNLQGEWVFKVGGLRSPIPGEDENIEAFSAIQLFAQSARRVCPGFRLGEQEKRWVVRICQMVEGMPLAIKLAASWAQALSCAEIAGEIESDLDFLSSSLRDLPDRHRSLRATFDHSWNFLSETEKEIFKRLSVFQGGFTREAAEVVAQASPVVLARLVEKSFLRWNAWAGRYEAHELLRQYAAEQLDASLERETRDQHCGYFVAFLNQREDALRGKGQTEALHEISIEIENVRQAWEWAITNVREEQIENGLEGLYSFYDIGSWFQEGREAFARTAAALGTGDSNPAVWKLRVRQGFFEFQLGQYPEAKNLLQQGLEFFRRLGDQAEMAFCLIGLANVAVSIGTYFEAAELAAQALTYAQTTQRTDLEAKTYLEWSRACRMQGDYQAAKPKVERALRLSAPASRLRADSLWNLGGVYYRLGKLIEAQSYCEQALHLCRQIGDRFGETATLIDLGVIAYASHDCERSISFYELALRLTREIGNRIGEITTLINLTGLLDYLGDLGGAQRYSEQALQICHEIGDQSHEGWVFGSLGLLYHHLGDDRTALEYDQQALSMAIEIGDRPSQGYVSTYLGHALHRLGELDQATDAYREAIAIWTDLGQNNLAIEPLAGLARIALDQGELSQALAYVEEILSHWQVNTLEGTEEPQRVYLTCYQVLDACQDDRATEILATAYHSLQEQAAKISDETLKRSFLENVTAHREIICTRQVKVGNDAIAD